MVNYTCKYCKNTFTNKSHLTRHQTKAEYCLQGRNLKKEKYICLCGKQLSREDVLRRHQEKCKVYQDSLQEESENEKHQNLLTLEFIKLINEININITENDEIKEFLLNIFYNTNSTKIKKEIKKISKKNKLQL